MSNGTGSGKSADTTSVSGVALLSLYLFFDAFQSQWQSGLFRKEKVSQLEMMRGVNAAASILSIVSLVRVHTVAAFRRFFFCQPLRQFQCWVRAFLQASAGELQPATAFIVRNPACLLHVGGLAITGTLGQLFIYYTISNFGPVIFSMVCQHQPGLSAYRDLPSCPLIRPSSFLGGVLRVDVRRLWQIMASRQLFSLVVSAALFGHDIRLQSLPFGVMVFGAMGYKIRKQVKSRGVQLAGVSQAAKSPPVAKASKKAD
jgi:hypothetical protein